MSAIDDAIDALTDAGQFIDAVRQDAISEGWWTEWDQQMRDKFGPALRGLYALKEKLPRIISETLDTPTLIDLRANNRNLTHAIQEIERLMS